jgi:hypothetical protein
VSAILWEPPRTSAHWRGAELDGSDAWVYRLSAAEVADLERALDHARGTGKPLEALEREDFPLPVLGPATKGWLRELQHGRGFLNVKGIPVERHSAEDAGWLHFGIGLHLGRAVSQNAAGDRLGHVRDTGADPADPSVRLYKTRVELGFHSDGADLIGLLCVRPARSGGETRLVSTEAVYAEILRRRPDLVPVLYEPFPWDRNDEQPPGEPPTFQLPICAVRGGRLTFFYIGWYIRKAPRHPGVAPLSRAQNEVLDLIDAIAQDPAFHLEMRLDPGEINFLKNNTALHARTAYEDFPEPDRRRHMVRLWLTAHGDWADGDDFLRQGIPRKAGAASDAETLAR